MRRLRIAACLALLGWVSPVSANGAADEIPSLPAFDDLAAHEHRSNLQLRIESHLIARHWRDSALLPAATQPANGLRTALDLRGEWALSPAWRFLLSDRIDHLWNSGESLANADLRNALREAYISGALTGERHVDFGRINLRHGVASGYNPTDFFRGHAVVSSASEDPGARRENRIGTVALRVQQLWTGGSASVVWSPKLAEARDSTASFADDLGRTNRQDRLLARVSLPTGETLGSELLAFHAAGEATQWGANLTALLDSATVAHLEWAGGRMLPLAARALNSGAATGEDWRNRVATGFAHTFGNRLTATLELQYDGAALAASEWQALRADAAASPQAVGRYRAIRALASAEAVPPTRRALFARIAWPDMAGIDNADLAVIARRNLDDRSSMAQVEVTWHRGTDHSLALQWIAFIGKSGSEYGAPAGGRTLTLRSTWYLR